MAKLNLDENEIKRLYVEEKKMIKEIAEIMNCDRNVITRRLQKLGLKEGKSYKQPKEKVDKLADKKELMKTLYLEGKTCKEIGEIVNLNEKTVSYHLRNLGIKKRSQKKINQEDFEKLWNEGKSDIEIAEFFGVKEITIKSYRTRGKNAGKFTRNDYFSEKDLELSNEQEQFILGSLLGDLSIDLTEQMKNAKLCLVHSVKQEELFMKKVEILGEFMGNYKLYSQYDNRTDKIYQTWRGNRKAHKLFNEVYNLLYPNKIKTITQEYLDKINHPIALAYWFMDDGSECGTIATNCFSLEEVELLINWLKTKWNIISTKQKNKENYVLHISQKSRLDFERLIFPYIVPSMYYKLKFLDILKAESV